MKRSVGAVAATVLVLALVALAVPVGAQTAVVTVDEENFRSEPRGSILGTVLRGTRLVLGEERDQWREATLEAWIWARSVQDQQRPVLDLIVNADGENLRATPNGERVGRAEGGMRLQRVQREGNWIRVRRTGWIWAPSIQVEEAAEPRPAQPSAEGPARASERSPERTPAGRPAESQTPAGTRTGAAGARVGAARGRFATLGVGVAVMGEPRGDTVATMARGATVEVLAEEAGWTRVRIEGWLAPGTLDSGAGGSGLVLRQISRDSLQTRPEAHRGRIVEWSVQFIALQQAERFRTDFAEGESYLLTRGPGEDSGFVYIAVGSDLLEAARALTPLQQVRVLARVRTVRSTLTGAPVLELLEFSAR